MLSETDGWTEDFIATPSENSRIFLLGIIKGNNLNKIIVHNLDLFYKTEI